jgi:hypothetical protein
MFLNIKNQEKNMSTSAVTKSLSIPSFSSGGKQITKPKEGLWDRIQSVFTHRPETSQENQIDRDEEQNIIRIISRQQVGSEGVKWVFSNADILYCPQGKTIHDTPRFQYIAKHCGREDLLKMLAKKYERHFV